MDNHWPTDVVEFGAINITGFRIVDSNRRAVRDFHDSRKRLEPNGQSQNSVGANGLPAISVNCSATLICFWPATPANPWSPSLQPLASAGPGRPDVRCGFRARRSLQSHFAQEAGSVPFQSSAAPQSRRWVVLLRHRNQRVQCPAGLQYEQGLGDPLGAGRENLPSTAQGEWRRFPSFCFRFLQRKP